MGPPWFIIPPKIVLANSRKTVYYHYSSPSDHFPNRLGFHDYIHLDRHDHHVHLYFVDGHRDHPGRPDRAHDYQIVPVVVVHEVLSVLPRCLYKVCLLILKTYNLFFSLVNSFLFFFSSTICSAKFRSQIDATAAISFICRFFSLVNNGWTFVIRPSTFLAATKNKKIICLLKL